VKKRLLLILAGLLLMLPVIAAGNPIKDDETIIFFPTNAALDTEGKVWVISIHGWIFEREAESVWRKVLLDRLAAMLEVEPDAASWPIYRKRAQMFLVDNERGKEIEVELSGKRFSMRSSQPNGHFQGVLYRDHNPIGDQTEKNWVTFRAVTGEGDKRVFQGKAHLIDPQGISVIWCCHCRGYGSSLPIYSALPEGSGSIFSVIEGVYLTQSG